jgi:hypothetical protein
VLACLQHATARAAQTPFHEIDTTREYTSPAHCNIKRQKRKRTSGERNREFLFCQHVLLFAIICPLWTTSNDNDNQALCNSHRAFSVPPAVRESCRKITSTVIPEYTVSCLAVAYPCFLCSVHSMQPCFCVF